MLGNKYVYLNNNKIFAIIFVNKEDPDYDMFKAAFATGTKAVDITDTPEVSFGWAWNGSKFVRNEIQ